MPGNPETNDWVAAEHGRSRPVAAPLPECARHLGITEDQAAKAAAQVAPYPHADGYDCYSLRLIEKVLWPERFHTSKGHGERRKRKREPLEAEAC
jgi:hypothetical protein